MTLAEAADEFLRQPRIAVAGVSRDTKQPANLIFRRLRDTGHQVFAINPNAEEVEGVRAYGSAGEINGGLDGVVIVTPPGETAAVAADCAKAGVPRVWIHRGLGPGSSSAEAVEICRRHGIAVIPGGCPNMFGATADPGHRCIRVMLSVTRRIPRSVEFAPGAPTS
jgi:predicted CoA-binding protein